MDWAEKRSWKEDRNGAQWLGLAFGFFRAGSGSSTSAVVSCSPLPVHDIPLCSTTGNKATSRCIIQSRAGQSCWVLATGSKLFTMWGTQ